MKIFKRILSAAMSAVCTAVACVTILPKMETEVFAQITVGELTFNVYNNEYAAVSSCIVTNATKVDIPSGINGIPVTTIMSEAFVGCNDLRSVYIPPSVTEINHGAFENCASLRYVNIPSSVISIDTDAFSGTPILEEQTGDIKYIGSWVVGYTGDSESIRIEPDTRGIAHSAFQGASFKSITLPSSLRIIDDYAFCAVQAALTEITIPYGVESIGICAFAGCTKLERVSLPNSLKTIGHAAFSSCRMLSGVDIPDSVTRVGVSAFSDTKEFADQEGPVYYVDDWAVCTDTEISGDIVIEDGTRGLSDQLFETRSVSSVQLPEGLEIICSSVFSSAKTLESVNFPKSLKRIGDWAFRGTNIKSVVIPKGVTVIEEYAFSSSAVSEITLPETLTAIEEGGLQGTQIKKINLPESVDTIGTSAMYNCSELVDITIRNPELKWDFVYYASNTTPTYHVVYNSKAHEYMVKNSEIYCILGDATADKTLNLYDVIGICKHFMNMEVLSGDGLINADYNGDGLINLYDAVDTAKRIMSA